MTDREREVLELIKKNPSISHSDIAAALGISRSTAAVYIASLTQQGEILGKQYVLAEDYVVCMGTAVADIFGFVSEKTIPGSGSLVGRVRIASGGAARNIGENLARLGTHAKLLSAVGDDRPGQMILRDSAEAHLDVEDVYTVPGEHTATFVLFSRQSGESSLSLIDHEIRDRLDIRYLKSKEHIIANARAVMVSDLPSAVLVPYLHNTFPDKLIFGDSTNIDSPDLVRECLDCFHSFQANRHEAEQITGIRIRNEDTLSKAADFLLRRGVHRAVITLGPDGAYYKDADGMALRRHTKHIDTIRNETGAGDAFSAGYLHCLLRGRSPVYAIDFAMACAVLALSAESSINPNLCESLAEQVMLDYCGE